MQSHTLGEVGILGTVLLRVSFGTILPIFIEIGSYLTDKEQQISWHSFFETRRIRHMTPITSSDDRVCRQLATGTQRSTDGLRRIFLKCSLK